MISNIYIVYNLDSINYLQEDHLKSKEKRQH